MSSIPLASKPPQARSSGAPNPIFLVLGCTVFAAAAQVLMKFGAMHPMPGISLSDLSTIPAFVVGLIGNWQLLLGYTMHACNAFLLILALRDGELSMLYPIIALTYVWVSILSMHFFHDNFNWWKGMGIVLVIGGVSLMGITSRRK
jgi:multidrug transporter EmrE-like cation transporter